MSKGAAVRQFNPEDDTKPTIWILISMVCPYAEKAIAALNELGVAFDVIEVDPTKKPASLFEVNKRGLVPAMRDQGNAIAESYVILEYINDMWRRPDGRGIFPDTPAQRAIARTWCTTINSTMGKCWYGVIKSDDKGLEEAIKQLQNAVKDLDEAMRSISDGPFFMGKEYGVVDMMLAPHVYRFLVLERLKGFKVPDTEEFQRFRNWWKAVDAVPSYKRSRGPLDVITELYRKTYL